MEKVAVKYVGKRETYIEGTYGSRIEFAQGKTVLVPADLAAKLLRHPDVYVQGKEKGAEVVIEAEKAAEQDKQEQQEQSDLQDVRDRIAVMDKAALESFVKTTYRVDIDKRKGVEALRQQAIGLVDQFGAA